MGFSVELTKDGLLARRYAEKEILVPEGVFDLLGVWHWTLHGIDPDYTLGDLLSLLRGVVGIEDLSGMLSCDLPAFLAEAEREPAERDGQDMRFLEVHNEASLTSYQEDPENPDEPMRLVDEDEAGEHDAALDALHALIGEKPPLKLVDATGDDPITGKPVRRRILPGTQNGRWVGPYHIHRGFQGWGRWEEPHPNFFTEHPEIDPDTFEGGFALELTPVNELVHYPLRYNPAIAFHDGGPQGGEVILRDEITITFGEFVYAVFWELGFMGSPELRDESRAMLRERAARLDEEFGRDQGEDDEPWR
ncbi:MAG TPA: hypothetical protein VF541_13255 [Longimicrobium sp.]|jgi:hypothetical protein